MRKTTATLVLMLLGSLGCRSAPSTGEDDSDLSADYGEHYSASLRSMYKRGGELVEAAIRENDWLINTRGFGRYYGSGSAFKQMNDEERLNYLQKNVTPYWDDVLKPNWLSVDDIDVSLKSVQESSCITFVQTVMEEIFCKEKDDTAEFFVNFPGKNVNICEAYKKQILPTLTRSAQRGTALGNTLYHHGWRGIYFIADTENHFDSLNDHAWSSWLQMKDKLTCLHSKHPDCIKTKPERCEEYNQGAEGRCYYGIPIDDYIGNYRPNDDFAPDDWEKRETKPGYLALKNVPFFFGVAAGGRHTFVGANGYIYEFHWDSNPVSNGYRDYYVDEDGDDVFFNSAIDSWTLDTFSWSAGALLIPKAFWDTKMDRRLYKPVGGDKEVFVKVERDGKGRRRDILKYRKIIESRRNWQPTEVLEVRPNPSN